MLDVDDVRRRAEMRYRKALKAGVAFAGDFPLRLPLGRIKGTDVARIAREVLILKAASDEERADGFTLEYVERSSRSLGRNRFPTHARFEDVEHLARFLGREAEWLQWCGVLAGMRERFPAAVEWMVEHWKLVLPVMEDWEVVEMVLAWRVENAEVYCYLREIPALPHSKFIEENSALIFGLLGIVVPENVRGDFKRPERRHGFRKREHFFVCRVLGSDVLGWPFKEMALHPDDLIALDAAGVERVIVVENQVNLHTLPDVAGGLAIHGSGAAVGRLARAKWLRGVKLVYWGDMDEHGFDILLRWRRSFPETRSIFMGGDDLRELRGLAGEGKVLGRTVQESRLTAAERVAFRWCRRFGRRVEQERIPNEWVAGRLDEVFGD